MTDSEAPAFRVDLRGLVDLLSRHLYSSPRVYLRELAQNAVDAVAARAAVDPHTPRTVEVVPADVAEDGCLRVRDEGIGLDRGEIDELLATIGASSKRDELGFGRETFLGQFGIGLLSCFLVTDEIVLRTRRHGGDGRTWEWRGRARGDYAVREAAEPLDRPGTEVRLRPTPDHRLLLEHDTVLAVLRDVAGRLPVDLRVRDHAGATTSASRGPFPWERPELDPAARRAAVLDLGAELLGHPPLDAVELVDEATGVRGVAYVLPAPAAPRAGHRVHARGMLVGRHETGVLPPWAFWVRAVLDVGGLRLTASREQLAHDDVLAEVAERLGARLLAWLRRTLATDPTRAQRLLDVHGLGLRAAAAHDPELLRLVAESLRFETTLGPHTLADAAATGTLELTTSPADFAQVEPLARAHGRLVVDASHAYDTDLIDAWVAAAPGRTARRLDPGDLALDLAPPDDPRRFAGLERVAADALARADCRPSVRAFEPAQVPAVLLAGREARFEAEREEVAAGAEGGWAASLAALAAPDRRPAFVLNARHPLVRRLADAAPDLQRDAVEVLYAQALVAGRHRVRPFDAALLARALPTLLARVLDAPDPTNR